MKLNDENGEEKTNLDVHWMQGKVKSMDYAREVSNTLDSTL